MNIFVLSSDPIVAARYHLDKHVVKMPLETAQILCTVNRKYGNNYVPYKATHANHPCTLWAGKSTSNYKWLVELGLALCKEYSHRYGRIHKCEAVIRGLATPPDTLPVGKRTRFACAMPDDCKSGTAVSSYRRYYKMYKRHISSYTNRHIPEWFKEGI